MTPDWRSQTTMRFIELFAGIGGFRLGLERVCVKNKTTVEAGRQIGESQEGIRDSRGRSQQRSDRSPNGFTCVWSNEIDKYACQVYRKNYGEK